ncbi:MAG: RseA family anti-sigma factor [Burkholderiaceae bacterium]
MQDQDIKEVLSEYLDKGLSPAQASSLVGRLKTDTELQSTALSYWILSESMSGVTAARHSETLQARIAKQLEQEPHFMPQHHRLANVGAGLSPGEVRREGRGLGAGLRFAAGLAAFGFVAAVVWTVGIDGQGSGSPMLSLSSPSSQVVAKAPLDPGFASPQMRAMVEAHGPMIVRMRMDEQ